MDLIKIEKKYIKSIIPKRKEDVNKGSFKKVLNIAGSSNFPGAAFLSSICALKVGASYVTCACTDFVKKTIAFQSPNITFLTCKSSNFGTICSSNIEYLLNNIVQYPIISIGCGLSIDNNTCGLVESLIQKNLQNTTTTFIFDADSLNIIAKLGIYNLPKNSILTPHPKELSRLLNVKVEDIENNRQYFVELANKQYNSIILLKGHKTLICDGFNVYLNTVGNNSLAKAGTGDVLTGVISGLLAQHLSLTNACIFGVYLHGLSGKIASKSLSNYSVLASDLISFLPKAILHTQSHFFI